MPSSQAMNDKPKDSVLTENTDDFIIGDRVWVYGSKPGYIQYLGETRFSPGDWAGVVLDDKSGKNDGSVAGIRYFQCEPKRGVFARLHKLTRYPLVRPNDTPSPPSCLTPPPQLVQRSITPTRTPSPGARLREGDRVTVVSGGGQLKSGVLRYIGQTDFATGEWAGVELDEPLGKNDGTVAGKRYFVCSPHHGLFSPLHKVSKVEKYRATDALHSYREEDQEIQNKDLEQAVPQLKKVERELASVQEEHRRYVDESEKRAQKLRLLVEAAEKDRKNLAAALEQERRKVEELEFRVDEECIGKDDLELERKSQRQKLEDLERRLQEEARKNKRIAGGESKESVLEEQSKRYMDEIESLRDKLKREELKVKETMAASMRPIKSPIESELRRKDESLLQTQLSLDNKRREVESLHARIAEMEKDLQKSKARQERQLETIDDLNLRLQKSESRCVNLEEDNHSYKEHVEELDRRLLASLERVEHLESEKSRLEEQAQQVLAPEEKESALINNLNAQIVDKDRLYVEARRELEIYKNDVLRLKEERERLREDQEQQFSAHDLESRRERKRNEDVEEQLRSQIRELDWQLKDEKSKSESLSARLSRQEARLQEADLKMAASRDVARLREQLSSLQADRDLLQVEKEETSKRLQLSEEARHRWESEAHRASEEVQTLRAQVQKLVTEFSSYKQDLVRRLDETKHETQMVEELYMQIETQRRTVEEIQQRLRTTEVQRDELQTVLTTTQYDQEQMENTSESLRQQVDTLHKRLYQTEVDRQSLERNLEASTLLLEQREEGLKLERGTSDEERFRLENQIAKLQVELSALKRPDYDTKKMIEEREALEHQVEFMNKVIVDMQQKNDDLKGRLEILETEVIFDGHLSLGTVGNRVRSRLYCDICDTFNLHDTEDCPKQAAQTRRKLSYSSQESEF